MVRVRSTGTGNTGLGPRALQRSMRDLSPESVQGAPLGTPEYPITPYRDQEGWGRFWRAGPEETSLRTSLETAKNQQRAIIRGSVPNITVVSIPTTMSTTTTICRTLSVRECARLRPSRSLPLPWEEDQRWDRGGSRSHSTPKLKRSPPRLAESLGNLILGLICGLRVPDF